MLLIMLAKQIPIEAYNYNPDPIPEDKTEITLMDTVDLIEVKTDEREKLEELANQELDKLINKDIDFLPKDIKAPVPEFDETIPDHKMTETIESPKPCNSRTDDNDIRLHAAHLKTRNKLTVAMLIFFAGSARTSGVSRNLSPC